MNFFLIIKKYFFKCFFCVNLGLDFKIKLKKITEIFFFIDSFTFIIKTHVQVTHFIIFFLYIYHEQIIFYIFKSFTLINCDQFMIVKFTLFLCDILNHYSTFFFNINYIYSNLFFTLFYSII